MTRSLLAATAFALACGAAAAGPLRAAGPLLFTDADTLVVADWRAQELHALRLPPAPAAAARPFNLRNVAGPVAAALHVRPDQVRFEDMAFRPGAETAWLALSVDRGGAVPAPALVSVDSAGKVTVIRTEKLPQTTARITNPPAGDKRLWRDTPEATLTVTDLAFHDGKLYVGVGDNARGAPAQDKASLFGKLLRLNPDGTIPTDNPFYATSSGDARAVWAYGLRNPFTFAVRASDGRIHINDVGQNTWEEIDLGAPGANYGWPGSEGNDNLGAGLTGPLFTYKHTAASPAGSGPGGFMVGQCIAGGAFYPAGGSFPARYHGSYFFADYVARTIGRIDLANGNAGYAFAKLAGEPVDMLVGRDGALYVLTRSGVTRIAAT